MNGSPSLGAQAPISNPRISPWLWCRSAGLQTRLLWRRGYIRGARPRPAVNGPAGLATRAPKQMATTKRVWRPAPLKMCAHSWISHPGFGLDRREAHGRENSLIGQDGHRLIAREPRRPGGAVLAHGIGRRGIGIGGGQVRTDDGDREDVRGGIARARVDDVRAALVGAGGGDRLVGDRHHGRQLVTQKRVLDTDAPVGLGGWASARGDVTPGIEAVVP